MPISKKQLLRITRLLSLLRARRYPNCTTFVRMLRNADVYENMNIVCSEKTIYRDIQVLKNDFHAPIKFNKSRNGYYLTNLAWKFSNPDIDAIISSSESFRSEDNTLDAKIPPDNETPHLQTTVCGINSRTGKEFHVTCDIDIAPLIEKLNAGGVETLFYNQDGIDNSSRGNQPHLTFKVESSEQLAFAVQIIKKFWTKKFMSVMLDDHGKIIIRVFKDRQQFIQAAELISISSIGF